MKYKILLFVIMLSLMWSSVAYGEGWTHPDIWVQYGNGNRIREGGVNSLCGVKCESKEETYALEQKLRSSGYILVTTDDKEISDEEFALLTEGNYRPQYFQYFDNDNVFEWQLQMYKVYMYRTCLRDALEQLKEKGAVDNSTKIEIAASTVVINYATWYFEERVGKVLNEINDNIPYWYTETGYLEIYSPIDAEVTLELWGEHTYEVLYVKADIPLLVLVKEGMHVVRDINYIGIGTNESAIAPLNNLVVRADVNTINNPKIMSLEGVVTKYNIPSMDISDKPDYDWNNKDNLDKGAYDIPVNRVIVPAPVDDDTATEKPRGKWLLVLLLIIAAAGLLLLLLKKYKERGRFHDDE